MVPWRNRIVEQRLVPVKELRANPANWRRHPKQQRDALGGALEQIGVVQGVILNLRSTAQGWGDGELPTLIDGHLRLELAEKRGEKALPTTVVDLSPDEERLTLATIDPIGAMATTAAEQLSSLLQQVTTDHEGLAALLTELGSQAPIAPTLESIVATGPPTHRPELQAPFPWFGGKSRVAEIVWQRFGNCPNYVEPFYGSGAVLLGRPKEHVAEGEWPIETVNDKDGFVADVWRAIAWHPKETVDAADWPVNENDLTARHIWLVGQRAELTAKLEGDPEFCDILIAGWWLWGICSWIGGGWCSGIGPWRSEEGKLVRAGGGGRGVDRKRPHLDGGQGVNRQLPHLGGGQGVNRRGDVVEWFTALSARLRRVRVCCGDWQRVLGHSPTTHNGLTGVFLDPPYSQDIRDAGCYSVDEEGLSAQVAAWAREHGDDPQMRIALCGYEGEHKMPAAWECVPWKTQGGYANQGEQRGRDNASLERVWFSPHCLQ